MQVIPLFGNKIPLGMTHSFYLRHTFPCGPLIHQKFIIYLFPGLILTWDVGYVLTVKLIE